jgi:RimJ/RimL family protein N-acetyltransferase
MDLDGLRLETPRLLLRPLQPGDLTPWTQMLQDPETCRFIGGVQPPSLAWRTFMTMFGAWRAEGFAMFSVLERDSGRWVGRCGPWSPLGWPGTEVGYSFLRDTWGRGYATEAATAAIDWSLETLGWTDVIQTIEPDNIGSRRVAEKLGATLRGPGRLPPPHEQAKVEIWGQSREQWLARRAPSVAPGAAHHR